MWVLVYFCGLWFQWQLVFTAFGTWFWSFWLILYRWGHHRTLCLRGQMGFFQFSPLCVWALRFRSLRPVVTNRFPRPSACCSGIPLSRQGRGISGPWGQGSSQAKLHIAVGSILLVPPSYLHAGSLGEESSFRPGRKESIFPGHLLSAEDLTDPSISGAGLC